MKEEEKDRHKAYMDTFKRLNAKLHIDRLGGGGGGGGSGEEEKEKEKRGTLYVQMFRTDKYGKINGNAFQKHPSIQSSFLVSKTNIQAKASEREREYIQDTSTDSTAKKHTPWKATKAYKFYVSYTQERSNQTTVWSVA